MPRRGLDFFRKWTLRMEERKRGDDLENQQEEADTIIDRSWSVLEKPINSHRTGCATQGKGKSGHQHHLGTGQAFTNCQEPFPSPCHIRMQHQSIFLWVGNRFCCQSPESCVQTIGHRQCRSTVPASATPLPSSQPVVA